MERVMTLKSPEITVRVEVKAKDLQRYEEDSMLDDLADGLARVISDAKFVGCPLTRIRRTP